MNEKSLQTQINTLNDKMDLLLEYVTEQRKKTETVDDLISDFSIIGKDVYDTAVEELNNQAIELNPEELTELGIQFLRNIPTFINLMNSLESTMDLLKEAGPIVNEVIIDTTKTLGEFEQKGYFEFLKEVAGIVDNIVSGFTPEDVKSLADNIVSILETVKHITQPDMIKSIDNAVKIYASIEMENVPEYSMIKTIRVLNTKEMRKSLGFIITFLQNLSKTINN